MFDVNKIHDFEYLEFRMLEIIEELSPIVSEKVRKTVAQSMDNMRNEPEARLYIFNLASRLRVYNLEFLTWRDNPRYAVLVFLAIKKYYKKYGI